MPQSPVYRKSSNRIVGAVSSNLARGPDDIERQPKSLVLVSCAAALALVLAVFAGAAQKSPADPEVGKVVYVDKCQRCHAADGHGDAEMAKDLEVEFPFLGSERVQALTDAQIRRTIVRGKDTMVRIKGLKAQQIRDVTAYLRTFKKKK